MNRLHLYEDKKGILHLCEGGQIGNDRSTYVVWTKCGKDVPKDKSFLSYENVTCKKCLASLS